jgi:putative RNA 2'-phosphotransferase
MSYAAVGGPTQVDAAAVHAAGHAFYQAANGAWLTDHVPPGDLPGWLG